MSFSPALRPERLRSELASSRFALLAHLDAEPSPLARRLAELVRSMPELLDRVPEQLFAQCAGRLRRDEVSAAWLDAAIEAQGLLRLCSTSLGAGPSPLAWKEKPHHALVHGLVVLDDGETLVSAGEDGRLLRWTRGNPDDAKELAGHQGPVNSLARSPDGRTVVSGGDDFAVGLWDTQRWSCRQLRAHTQYVRQVACTDELLLSGSQDGLAILWDLESGRRLHTLEHGGHDVMAVALSPSGRLAATTTINSSLYVWDTRTGELLRKLYGTDAPVLRLPGFSGLYLGGTNDSGVGHKNHPHAMGFTEDDRWLWSLDAELLVWDLATGEEHRRYRTHSAPFMGAALARDGTLYAVANGLHRWRVRDGERWLDAGELEEQGVLGGGIDGLECVTLAPGGSAVLVGSRSGEVTEWRLPIDPSALQGLEHGGSVNDVVTVGRGERIVTRGGDHSVVVWDAASGEALVRAQGGMSGGGTEQDVSPDGRWLLVVGDKAVQLWDLERRERVLERTAPQDQDYQTLLSGKLLPGAQRALVGSISTGVFDMDLGPEEEHARLEGFTKQTNAIALSPDGAYAVLHGYFAPSESDDDWQANTAVLQVYDLKARRELWRLFAVKPEGAKWALNLEPPHVLADGSGLVGLSGQRKGELVHWRWDGTVVQRWETEWTWLYRTRELEDGRLLLQGSVENNEELCLGILDVRNGGNGLEQRSFPTHANAHVLRGEGRALVLDGTALSLVQLQPFRELAQVELGAPLQQLAVDSTERWVFVGTRDGRVHRLELG